ncbi:hypothetical protein SPRG_04284 [Saprolegnia parasitica CBS 223.65]|uniref:Uncharacterized protein n=1 Tax=Saprolegnia parasitica (strain CBS 223.65) TaxID=695850 RepID=A0A067CXA7_SAPPC|nr:hypothetical protein SPRG_04284 [Saprolegnia parasitica CBS 223.65]KDO31146.1 hypothetical protein SPRG_04284 [Saprolegnia parasitica CBS 223.65]|eukprot:XP_012198273.1 hypothetical protein SPRG_04284 [Saprolegnia parasitica CBS 223.65]
MQQSVLPSAVEDVAARAHHGDGHDCSARCKKSRTQARYHRCRDESRTTEMLVEKHMRPLLHARSPMTSLSRAQRAGKAVDNIGQGSTFAPTRSLAMLTDTSRKHLIRARQ